MHPVQDQTLSTQQIIQLTRAMLSVASVDGLQPAEGTLISQFYEASRSADMPTTAAAMANAGTNQFTVAELEGSTPEFADTMILMCLMAAYADGHLSAAERLHVQSIATQLKVDASRFDGLLAQVRDELVGALSHLPDAGSVAVVVKELAAADE